MASTVDSLEMTDSALESSMVASFLSDDGKAFYLHKLVMDGGSQENKVVREKWDLTCTTPKLVHSTTSDVSTIGWETGLLKIEDLDEARLQLMPSKPIPAPPNLHDFLHSAQLRDRVPLGSWPRADTQDDSGRLSAEYWGHVSHRDNFVILCRRKRLHSPPEDDPASRRRNRKAAMMERRKRRRRQKKTYDVEMDFDDIPESDTSSQANDFDLASEPEDARDDASSSHSGSPESSLSASDQAEEMEDDMRSLSDVGSTRSGSSNSWGSSSIGSSASSSSSKVSNMSAERLRMRETLSSSDNARHYDEMVKQHKAKQCDECQQLVSHWLHCFKCAESDYDVCLSCIDKGRWCLKKSHELLETDEDGPITMHRFSGWEAANELRVYELHDDGTQNCVLEFSAGGEDLLHESQPAIHPSAPIFAWPLSPTRLLLGSFEGDKERVIQKMKPFVKHGRKIDVQVRFSDSGSHLFVASIEAVKVRDQSQEKTYDLHMQVAVLQLRFEGQVLTHPLPVCERHHGLRINLPSTLETLPLVWTWTANEVCLTLTRDHISLWRVKFNYSEQGQYYLGPVETSTAHPPLDQKVQPFKAQFIYPGEGNVPVVALAPLHVQKESKSPSFRCIEAAGPWSACDEEDDPSRSGADVPPASLIVGPRSSSGAAFSTSPTQLSQVRSEIRLLCLVPGSGDDALRCTLTKVSLDDLEVSKSKLKEHFDSRRDSKEKSERSNGNASERKDMPDLYSPDFEPKVVARVDYSRTEDADVALWELLGRAMSQSDTLGENLKSIGFSKITGNTLAVVGGIMEERNQDRTKTFRNWLHPKYNYEALSYVWGESTGNRTINLDGKKDVPVTDNLYAALRRLRRPDRQRTLWVDALCIDQKNVEERNWQVQMMGRIYSTSARVVVWLGDAEDPDPSLDFASNAGEDESSEEEDDKSDEEDPSSSRDKKSNKVKQWQTDTLGHVLETASPPWWTRAWVTQELVLADEVNVAFGPVEVGWTKFKSNMWGTWSSVSELKQLIALRQNRRTWHYKGSIGETALLAQHTNATDPRDKVYSLLSLVKPGQQSRVKPDYGLEPVDIFIQATYADLWDNVYGDDIYKESPEKFDQKDQFRPEVPKYPASSGLDHLVQTGLRPDRFRILNWAKPSAPNRPAGMPSWALDFSDPSVFTGDSEFRFGFERWSFDGNNDLNQRALLKLSEDSRQLTVRGAVLGRIKDIVKDYPVREYRIKPAEDVIARLSVLLSNLPSESPYEVVSGPNAKLRTDDLRVIRRPNWIVKETKPGAVVVEHEEVVTQVLPHWDPSAEHGKVDWTDLHSVTLNRGGCDVEGCRCGPSQFFRSWDACVGVPYHARNFSNHDDKKTSPWERYCDLLKPNQPDQARDPLRDEESRFLLTTSSGFIGLGPEGAEIGDVIALSYGSDTPVVLRPDGDHYVYRGRAWINGIMQGELWNIYEDPLLGEQDFVIW